VTDQLALRPARLHEAAAISRLNNTFAARGVMLYRSVETIALGVDDYVVATTMEGEILGCGAIKEYSPSLAEVAAIAVDPTAQGRGVGRAIVGAVEALALKRGIHEVFALTLEPRFFESLGYARVDRARYPEKIRRDCLSCARRFACNETCFARKLRSRASEEERSCGTTSEAGAEERLLVVAA
jgi:amino-acid N-acetyltransferase